MARPKIAVFSGPTSTIANSPSLVTSNKGRLEGEKTLPGRFGHLVAQSLYEPVIVRIKKFSAHPMEEDAKDRIEGGVTTARNGRLGWALPCATNVGIRGWSGLTGDVAGESAFSQERKSGFLVSASG